MLFNRAINNTDDHERNFSLITQDDGYRMKMWKNIWFAKKNGE